MTTPTQDLIERLRNGTAHLSLRQIEELWADAAGALEAAIKTQQLGQTKPAQDDNLYRLSLLVESDVLPDGLEVRRVVKAALQEFAALRRAADRITELQDEVGRLREACRQSAVMFRFYEQSHLAKKTQDGDEKAHRNHEMAAMCEAALDQQGDRG